MNGGGPAFPQWDGHAITSEPQYLRGGMSLRDWFAGMALQGMLAQAAGARVNHISEKQMAEASYKVADAMLAERNRHAPTP